MTENLPEKDALLKELALTAPKNIRIEDIIEYKIQGLKDSEIGTLLNCSQQNISERLKDYRDEVESLSTFKKHRADTFAVVQSKLINSLSPDDIKKSSAYQKIGMVSLLHEKESLERGQATQIIRYDAQALRERYDELKRMLDETIDVTPEDV